MLRSRGAVSRISTQLETELIAAGPFTRDTASLAQDQEYSRGESVGMGKDTICSMEDTAATTATSKCPRPTDSSALKRQSRKEGGQSAWLTSSA